MPSTLKTYSKSHNCSIINEICYYKDENPGDGLVVKIPNSSGSLRYIDLYALDGSKKAQGRLGGGLAAQCFIIDGRKDRGPFIFYSAERGRTVSEVAIIQEKIFPFIDYLKRLCRSGCREEDIYRAIQYINKLKNLIIEMYRRGIVDIDHFNIAGNYGIRKSDDSMRIFDLGDLSARQQDAADFTKSLPNFNCLMAEGLSEVEGTTIDCRIADFYREHPLLIDNFFGGGKDLFGTAYHPDTSPMRFPHSEQELRGMFLAIELKGERKK